MEVDSPTLIITCQDLNALNEIARNYARATFCSKNYVTKNIDDAEIRIGFLDKDSTLREIELYIDQNKADHIVLISNSHTDSITFNEHRKCMKKAVDKINELKNGLQTEGAIIHQKSFCVVR